MLHSIYSVSSSKLVISICLVYLYDAVDEMQLDFWRLHGWVKLVQVVKDYIYTQDNYLCNP